MRPFSLGVTTLIQGFSRGVTSSRAGDGTMRTESPDAGPGLRANGPRLRNPTSRTCVTSTNAIPHVEALNPHLIAGRHRQPQHHASVGFCDEERQLSLSSR